jgi:prevent-host-death family protein
MDIEPTRKLMEPKRVTATQLRVHLGEVLDAIEHRREPYVIERGGREMAAVIPIDDFRRQRKAALSEDWWRRQEQVARELEKNLNGRPYPDVDELIDHGER